MATALVAAEDTPWPDNVSRLAVVLAQSPTLLQCKGNLVQVLGTKVCIDDLVTKEAVVRAVLSVYPSHVPGAKVLARSIETFLVTNDIVPAGLTTTTEVRVHSLQQGWLLKSVLAYVRRRASRTDKARHPLIEQLKKMVNFVPGSTGRRRITGKQWLPQFC